MSGLEFLGVLFIVSLIGLVVFFTVNFVLDVFFLKETVETLTEFLHSEQRSVSKLFISTWDRLGAIENARKTSKSTKKSRK